VSEAIDELPGEDLYPIDVTVRTGPPRGMTQHRSVLPLHDPTIRTGPPPLPRAPAVAPQTAEVEAAVLPPVGFTSVPQDLIRTQVARPRPAALRKGPREQQVAGRPPPLPEEFLADEPSTGRWVPLRRDEGLVLEYFRALERHGQPDADAPPGPLPPLLPIPARGGWRSAALSIFLGVGLGLGLALVGAALLLLVFLQGK
jgi:hypothetical protein